MNDGRQFELPNTERVLVDDIAAHVLARCPDGGKLRTVTLALVCMTSIEPTEEHANA